MIFLDNIPFRPISPPANLKDTDKVFFLECTGEIFTDYESYYERLSLCLSSRWSCDYHPNITGTLYKVLKTETEARKMFENLKQENVLKDTLKHIESTSITDRITMEEVIVKFLKENIKDKRSRGFKFIARVIINFCLEKDSSDKFVIKPHVLDDPVPHSVVSKISDFFTKEITIEPKNETCVVSDNSKLTTETPSKPKCDTLDEGFIKKICNEYQKLISCLSAHCDDLLQEDLKELPDLIPIDVDASKDIGNCILICEYLHRIVKIFRFLSQTKTFITSVTEPASQKLKFANFDEIVNSIYGDFSKLGPRDNARYYIKLLKFFLRILLFLEPIEIDENSPIEPPLFEFGEIFSSNDELFYPIIHDHVSTLTIWPILYIHLTKYFQEKSNPEQGDEEGGEYISCRNGVKYVLQLFDQLKLNANNLSLPPCHFFANLTPQHKIDVVLHLIDMISINSTYKQFILHLESELLSDRSFLSKQQNQLSLELKGFYKKKLDTQKVISPSVNGSNSESFFTEKPTRKGFDLPNKIQLCNEKHFEQMSDSEFETLIEKHRNGFTQKINSLKTRIKKIEELNIFETLPIGYDRFHRRYWNFPSVFPNDILIETTEISDILTHLPLEQILLQEDSLFFFEQDSLPTSHTGSFSKPQLSASACSLLAFYMKESFKNWNAIKFNFLHKICVTLSKKSLRKIEILTRLLKFYNISMDKSEQLSLNLTNLAGPARSQLDKLIENTSLERAVKYITKLNQNLAKNRSTRNSISLDSSSSSSSSIKNSEAIDSSFSNNSLTDFYTAERFGTFKSGWFRYPRSDLDKYCKSLQSTTGVREHSLNIQLRKLTMTEFNPLKLSSDVELMSSVKQDATSIEEIEMIEVPVNDSPILHPMNMHLTAIQRNGSICWHEFYVFRFIHSLRRLLQDICKKRLLFISSDKMFSECMSSWKTKCADIENDLLSSPAHSSGQSFAKKFIDPLLCLFTDILSLIDRKFLFTLHMSTDGAKNTRYLFSLSALSKFSFVSMIDLDLACEKINELKKLMSDDQLNLNITCSSDEDRHVFVLTSIGFFLQLVDFTINQNFDLIFKASNFKGSRTHLLCDYCSLSINIFSVDDSEFNTYLTCVGCLRVSHIKCALKNKCSSVEHLLKCTSDETQKNRKIDADLDEKEALFFIKEDKNSLYVCSKCETATASGKTSQMMSGYSSSRRHQKNSTLTNKVEKTQTSNGKSSRNRLSDKRKRDSEGSFSDSDVSEGSYANQSGTEDEDDTSHEDLCAVCKIEKGVLLCCDACPLVYHLHCVDPPVRAIPRGTWYCVVCRSERNKSVKKQSQISKYLTADSAAPDQPSTSNLPLFHTEECNICEKTGKLLCCDTCSRSFHLSCLVPPLSVVPLGSWVCQFCREDPSQSNRVSDRLRSPKDDFHSLDRNSNKDAFQPKPKYRRIVVNDDDSE